MSNSKIREKLKYYTWSPIAILRHLFGKMSMYDLHKWNSNGIEEFEKFDDIELHIISPHNYISHTQEFEINGIHYHFIHNENDNLIDFLKYHILKKIRTDYSKNAKSICKLIDKINPDLIHIIGAENPEYSQAAINISEEKPIIVSLQTLLIDPIFLKHRPWFKNKEAYRVYIESKVIKRANYIGTKSKHFINIIKEKITPNAQFLAIGLAVEEKATTIDCKKEYDFVYYAKDIAKAVDYAIEAFALAKKIHPNITLHVVGGYNNVLMESLKIRMQELGLGDEIDFTGKLITHDEVIKEVKKAKFALLPVKADLVSGTIREAMVNGLPVITCITPVTPLLNEKRESILLSEKGDFQAMSNNMCRLIEDRELGNLLQRNAVETVKERYSNEATMKKWKDCYYNILSK